MHQIRMQQSSRTKNYKGQNVCFLSTLMTRGKLIYTNVLIKIHTLSKNIWYNSSINAKQKP